MRVWACWGEAANMHTVMGNKAETRGHIQVRISFMLQHPSYASSFPAWQCQWLQCLAAESGALASGSSSASGQPSWWSHSACKVRAALSWVLYTLIHGKGFELFIWKILEKVEYKETGRKVHWRKGIFFPQAAWQCLWLYGMCCLGWFWLISRPAAQWEWGYLGADVQL